MKQATTLLQKSYFHILLSKSLFKHFCLQGKDCSFRLLDVAWENQLFYAGSLVVWKRMPLAILSYQSEVQIWYENDSDYQTHYALQTTTFMTGWSESAA